jgi:hypothetical protein
VISEVLTYDARFGASVFDARGNMYVSGYFKDAADFGTGEQTVAGALESVPSEAR